MTLIDHGAEPISSQPVACVVFRPTSWPSPFSNFDTVGPSPSNVMEENCLFRVHRSRMQFPHWLHHTYFTTTSANPINMHICCWGSICWPIRVVGWKGTADNTVREDFGWWIVVWLGVKLPAFLLYFPSFHSKERFDLIFEGMMLELRERPANK